MDEARVKEFLLGFVRSRRREVSLVAALAMCGPGCREAAVAQLEAERREALLERERICAAASRLSGAEREVVTERYLSPVPIRHGGAVVGWRLKAWREIAENCGYTVRHALRLHRAALGHLDTE